MFDWGRQPGAVDPHPVEDDGSSYAQLKPEDLDAYINWGDLNLSSLPAPDRCLDPYVDHVRGYVPPDMVGAFSLCVSGRGGSSPSPSNCVGNMFAGVPGAAIGGMSTLLAKCP
jgi:hypothetical protein